MNTKTKSQTARCKTCNHIEHDAGKCKQCNCGESALIRDAYGYGAYGIFRDETNAAAYFAELGLEWEGF